MLIYMITHRKLNVFTLFYVVYFINIYTVTDIASCNVYVFQIVYYLKIESTAYIHILIKTDNNNFLYRISHCCLLR